MKVSLQIILNKLTFAQSSKRVTLEIQTLIDLFLLQQLYPRSSKKSIVNKLPTILITTNFFPRYSLVSGKTYPRRMHWFSQLKNKKRKYNNHFVAAAFLDPSKAFEFVSHEIFLKKLETLQFDLNAVSLIQCFFTGRTQRVVLSTSKSDWIILYQGVHQGTVLGPLLFSLYVSSMQNIMLESSNLVQYADDTFVFIAANCIITGITNLERILEKLIDYFVSHRLNINAKKQSLLSSVNHRKMLR